MESHMGLPSEHFRFYYDNNKAVGKSFGAQCTPTHTHAHTSTYYYCV